MLATALFLLASTQRGAALADLPFTMVGGRIYVDVKINGAPATAILDTGAGASIMDTGLADRLKLPAGAPIQAAGVGEATVTGHFLKDTVVTFGPVQHPISISIPLGSMTVAEGRPLESILGRDFFKRYVVQVDYPARRLRIFPPDIALKMKGTVIPISFKNNHPHGQATVRVAGKNIEVEAMFDSGATTSGLTGRFVKNNPIPADVPTTGTDIIGGGVGGWVKGRDLRIDALRLGDLQFSKPIVNVTESAGGATGENAAFDLLVGADVLSRTRLTIDYPHNRLVLEKTSSAERPFEANKTGLRLFAKPDNLRSYVVMGIAKGSSGEAAGVQVGDVIERVNGSPAGKWSLSELKDEFRSSKIKSWKLGLRRGGDVIEVTVPAKSPL